jgi:hypothetical protein
MDPNDASHAVRGSMVVLAAALGLACRRGASETAGNKQRTQSSPAASAAADGNSAVQSAADIRTDGGDTEPPIPVHQIGISAISDIYEFKFDSVKYCKKKADAGGESTSVLLGAKVQIKAKTNKLFVDPRYASLREGGIIYPAKVDSGHPGCDPALKPVSLRKEGLAAGFIVFELPRAWKEIYLDFQPVRWGGAGLVRFAVPRPADDLK